MTHRAESILAAITTAVTGLTSSGTNVVRGRVNAFDVNVTHGLTVSMADENPPIDRNLAYQDEALNVAITAHVKAADGQLDTELNKVAAEVYTAMFVDYKFGLDYVINTTWEGRTPPLRTQGEKPTAEQDLNFQITYRHSYGSPES